MRIEATGNVAYLSNIYGYGYEPSVSLIKRMEANEKRWIAHKRKLKRNYLKMSNQIAMELSRNITFYDKDGAGHSYEYYNFDAVV